MGRVVTSFEALAIQDLDEFNKKVNQMLADDWHLISSGANHEFHWAHFTKTKTLPGKKLKTTNKKIIK